MERQGRARCWWKAAGQLQGHHPADLDRFEFTFPPRRLTVRAALQGVASMSTTVPARPHRPGYDVHAFGEGDHIMLGG